MKNEPKPNTKQKEKQKTRKPNKNRHVVCEWKHVCVYIYTYSVCIRVSHVQLSLSLALSLSVCVYMFVPWFLHYGKRTKETKTKNTRSERMNEIRGSRTEISLLVLVQCQSDVSMFHVHCRSRQLNNPQIMPAENLPSIKIALAV